MDEIYNKFLKFILSCKNPSSLADFLENLKEIPETNEAIGKEDLEDFLSSLCAAITERFPEVGPSLSGAPDGYDAGAKTEPTIPTDAPNLDPNFALPIPPTRKNLLNEIQMVLRSVKPENGE